MMNELLASWLPDEILSVESEIEKLFALQDRPLGKEKKQLFVSESEKSGLPAKAIIAGTKKLQLDDLKQIKFAMIVEAAKDFLDPATLGEIYECDHCGKSGVVLMRDGASYEFALRCICRNGNRKSGLQRWNGEVTQTSNGRMLTLRHNTLEEKPYGRQPVFDDF